MILDASVVFKWIRDDDEQDRDKAISLFQAHLAGEEKIVILSFTYLEIANTLVTKTDVTKKELDLALEVLFETNLDFYEPVRSEIHEASLQARKYETSVYDMLYAIVAIKHKTTLVTADDKFYQATKFPFVKLLSEI